MPPSSQFYDDDDAMQEHVIASISEQERWLFVYGIFPCFVFGTGNEQGQLRIVFLLSTTIVTQVTRTSINLYTSFDSSTRFPRQIF
jgi:hypothetical protein